MKKSIFLCCIAFALLSCSNESGDKGSLNLTIAPYVVTGFVTPHISFDITSFAVEVRSESGEKLSYSFTDSGPAVISGIESGDCTVSVEAANINGKVLFRGVTDVLHITAGETSEAAVHLVPAEGQGKLTLEVELPEGVSGSPGMVTLRKGSAAAVPVSMTYTGAHGVHTGDYESGLYLLTVGPVEGQSFDRATYEALVLEGETTEVYYPPQEGNGSIPGGGTGNQPRPPVVNRASPLVADHRAVRDFSRIPDQYISQARRLLVSLPGESHVRALLYGFELLEREDPRFSVDTVWEGAPGAPRGNLRVSRTYWYTQSTGERWDVTVGEQDTWTHEDAIRRMIDNLLHHRNGAGQNGIGRPVDVFGWMWCWDMFELNYSESSGWGGRIFTSFLRADNAPQAGPWSLASTREVSLEDYFHAMEAAAAAVPETLVIYITGPVDRGGNTGGPGYQRWLKNNAIRSFVNQYNKVLFDYEDILSWDYGSGRRVTETWRGNRFPVIAQDNVGEYAGETGITREESGHVSRAGAIRLARAFWWLLARLSGWTG